MTRWINADELNEILNWTSFKPPYSKKQVRRFIEMARTVEAEPVRHGHWIKQKDGCVRPFWESHICSECRCQSGDTAYCPSCGAKMDGEASVPIIDEDEYVPMRDAAEANGWR